MLPDADESGLLEQRLSCSTRSALSELTNNIVEGNVESFKDSIVQMQLDGVDGNVIVKNHGTCSVGPQAFVNGSISAPARCD